MIKKLFIKIVVIALVISLTACGANTPNVTPSPSISAEPTPEAINYIYDLASMEHNVQGNKQGVYYEVFVRSFADSNGDGVGDINGLIEKLDYLNDGDLETTTDLGITGIWLMPINKTVSYHGYDVTDFYDINPEYGTLEDFERLLEECHTRGISVIMDLVLNHTSNRHEWFISSTKRDSPYRDWYLWADADTNVYNLNASIWGHAAWNKIGDAYYFGLFWSGMPDLNYDNPEVREEAKKIASFWLDKGVDGFRLDAVQHLYDSIEVKPGESGLEKSLEWWHEFKDYCHEVKPGSIIVGEVLNDSTSSRASFLPALDSCFHIGLGTQIINTVKGGGSNNNFLSNFIENNYTQYAAANPDYFDSPVLTNHDQNRIMGLLMGKPELMKVAAGIYLTVEGIPFIYYGEEIGMFGSKPDEDIRLPFIWGNNDPFQTTWRDSKFKDSVTPVSEQEKDPDSILTHYKRLIRVRNKNEALYAGKFSALDSQSPSIVAYKMESDTQSAIVLHNVSKEVATTPVDIAGYSLEFCQTKEGFNESESGTEIPALSTVIYVKNK